MNELNEVVESYNEYLSNVGRGIAYISDCLREDKVSEGLLAIQDFSEGILWLSNASELMKKNGVLAELGINQLQEFLIEINDGLEKQDYILVADLFEYEIAPFFEQVSLAEKLEQ